MVQPPVVGQDRGTWGPKLLDYIDYKTEGLATNENLDALEAQVAGNIAAIEEVNDFLDGMPTATEVADTVATVGDIAPDTTGYEGMELAFGPNGATLAPKGMFNAALWGLDGTPGEKSAGLQAAIDKAFSGGRGGTVWIPPFVHDVQGVTLKYQVNLFSDRNLGNGATLRLVAGATQPILLNDQVNGGAVGTSFIGGGSQRRQDSRIEGIRFDGQRTMQTSLDADCLRLTHAWDIWIRNCYFVHCYGFGIRALDCNMLTITQNEMTHAPCYFESLADSLITDNQVGGGIGNVSCVWWFSSPDEVCWSNIITNNFIFNNVDGLAYTVTVDPATDIFTTSSPHILTDKTPIVLSTTGTIPTGMVSGKTYYVDVLSSTTFKIATTRKNLDDAAYVNISGAGSGTHTVKLGEDCNLYLSGTQVKWNVISNNRIDQAHGHNVICDGARYNHFADNINFGAGLANATAQAGYKMQNGAISNTIDGGIIDGDIYTSGGNPTNQGYGVQADITSTGTIITRGTRIAGHATANVSIPDPQTNPDITKGQFLLIQSGDMEAISGSPTLGTISGGRWNGMLYDAAADEITSMEFRVPTDWATAMPRLYWVNAGAGAGAVVWNAQASQFAAGANTNAADTYNQSKTETAGAQDILVETTFNSPITVSAGGIIRLRIKREAVNAADTLANDAALIAVGIERVT